MKDFLSHYGSRHEYKEVVFIYLFALLLSFLMPMESYGHKAHTYGEMIAHPNSGKIVIKNDTDFEIKFSCNGFCNGGEELSLAKGKSGTCQDSVYAFSCFYCWGCQTSTLINRSGCDKDHIPRLTLGNEYYNNNQQWRPTAMRSCHDERTHVPPNFDEWPRFGLDDFDEGKD